MAIVGCSFHLPKTITGEAVNESGAALNDVAVTVCYSGWGWGDYLVWDEDYCSDPVFTDSNGQYVINFSGFLLPWSPASNSIKLWANKDGWTQVESIYIPNTRIIMTKNENIRDRHIAERRLEERSFQERLTEESDAEYYCRVILPKARSTTLIYQGESLSVTPSLLKYSDDNQTLFALSGSSRVVNAFSEEALLKINGQTVNVNFTLIADAKSCKPTVHFMAVNIPDLYLSTARRVEIFVPSIRALFDMKIWRPSAEQKRVE